MNRVGGGVGPVERGVGRIGNGVSRLARRSFLGLAAGAFAAPLGAACRGQRTNGDGKMTSRGTAGDEKSARRGRLLARPAAVAEDAPKGQHSLGVEGARAALVYVPVNYRRDAPAPLAVMLHGAGGTAEQAMSFMQRFADESNLIVVAPQSAAATWDAISGNFGRDVLALDRLLGQIFARYSVDARRVAVGGFSDGASYALGLGLTNGDLFTHVLAFSPGFVAGGRGLDQGQRPRLFVSHGTRDRVLPIDRCSRPIVEQARAAGYIVRYREFDGPHTVPEEIAREAVGWFVKK
jgi:phospholipase/carboxylesterase